MSALSIVLMSGCTGLSVAIYLTRDVKETSDEYEQEKHEERVDQLNKEYEEFLKSQDAAGGDDAESDQSIVIIKDEETG